MVPAAPTPLAQTAPRSAIPWEWPKRGDPRIPFAALLTLYGVLGFTVMGFNRSPGQMATIVLTGSALDLMLGRILKGRWVFPLSAYITCCSLALLLNYSHSSLLLFLPVYLAIGSKHLLTFQGRHVFNPSMFGVSVSLLVSRELVTAAPAYQWAGGALYCTAFLLMAALVMFVFRIGKTPLILSFLAFYAAQTGLRAWIMRHHLPPETLFLGTLSAPSFFLFVFYMLTDPATSPKTARGQVILAFFVALVDLALHFKESVFTFLYAALVCASARFLFLHARELWRGRLDRLRALLSPQPLSQLAYVGGLGVAMVLGYSVLAPPPKLPHDLTFRMERLPPEHTGIRTTMSDLLTQVDPRLRHISKWIMSVGDAVAVGDFDNDGKLDLFLTNALKSEKDRGALYRNLGDLRFERVPLPALEALVPRFREVGVPAGGAFVDYDGDGDQDLVVPFAFGRSRLFKNQLVETGQPTFVDVTDVAGMPEHTVSLSITFLDFDRDGKLDMLVSNALAPYLPDYARPTPLNIFALPQPEYPGDRRMFHFMHNGWHNADNGGGNVLYRARGDGSFERLDPAKLGMPETHWSLAVATADFNHDGWTDFYVANDFGPDDLYLNEHGAHVRRVQGRMFGEIGKDTYKGMNASVADFDRNGWLDVYVSNVHHALQAEGSLLWMVRPSDDPFVPSFTDEATSRGALNERRFGWGAAAGDLDNDGWPDLVQANGMVDDRLDHLYDSGRKDYWYVNHKLMQSGPDIHTYADMWGDIRGRTIYPNEARRAYLNLGDEQPGTFVDVAAQLGLDDPDNSRGVLLADLDNDGDLDVVITNQHGPVSIYRSTLRKPGEDNPRAGFVGLSLVGNGTTTNRSAIGTRVTIRYTEHGRQVQQMQEVGVMGGFSAQADPRLHFGLGAYSGPVEAVIQWYGGDEQRLSLEPNRYHEVRQATTVGQRPEPERTWPRPN